jgi:hypothetical protein
MFIANKYIVTSGIGLILLLVVMIYILLDDTPYHFDWKGYEPYTKIDTIYFGYFEVDKNEK